MHSEVARQALTDAKTSLIHLLVQMLISQQQSAYDDLVIGSYGLAPLGVYVHIPEGEGRGELEPDFNSNFGGIEAPEYRYSTVEVPTAKLPIHARSQIEAKSVILHYTVSQKNRTPATFCNNSNSPSSIAIDFDKNNR